MNEWLGQGLRFLDIHFLDVGHGDCTIVECPGHLTVIDVNNCKTFGKESETELRKRYKPPAPNPFLAGPYGAAASALGGAAQPDYYRMLAEMVQSDKKLKEAKDKLTNPIDYLKARFPGRSIFRYIQTHPDMDHMAGLHRIRAEEKIEIVNFWDTRHCVEKDEDAMRTGEVNHDIKDWRTYLQLRKSASNPTVLHLTHGAKGDFYTPDGISIWAPFDHSESTDPNADPNPPCQHL